MEGGRVRKAMAFPPSAPTGPTYHCPVFEKVSQAIKDKLKITPSAFDAKGDRCYCRECAKFNPDVAHRGSRPYILPKDCIRVGLWHNHVLAETNQVFEKWDASFHGTTIEGAQHIFDAGIQLLRAGDTSLGGTVLGVRKGHIEGKPFKRTNLFTNKQEIFDKDKIFSSPSLTYSLLNVYAKPFEISIEGEGERFQAKVAFQLRQRPGSYGIGQMTVGTEEEIDPLISNNELEYYTAEHVGIIVHGLIVWVDGITTVDYSESRRRDDEKASAIAHAAAEVPNPIHSRNPNQN